MVAEIKKLVIEENQPSYVEGLLVVKDVAGNTIDSFKFSKFRASPTGTTINDAFEWASKKYGAVVAIGPESKMYHDFLKDLGYKKFVDSDTNQECILQEEE